MECVQIDLNNVCRTCKSESPEMKSLHSRDSESGKDNPRLDEMLMACASVQVNNEDGLPKSICRSCFVQLKNAYSFKEQCEKTDSFLRDYLHNLRKQSIKEEIMTDVEYETNSTSNDIGQLNDDESIVSIKADPEQHSEESRVKDVDFVEVADNNLTIYECRTCSKTFYTLEDLRSHKRVHTGRTFKCKQCDKSYTKLNHLHRHERSHGKRKIHVCKICNKTLTRFKHLKRHLVTHLKEKPFGCPTCNRGFNRPEHLQNHVKSCKGEKAHVCDICNKGFSREGSLELHKRLHKNKKPVLRTLEDLGNIEEHYTEIDCDDNTTTFSDQSDAGGGDELDVAEEIMEPEVEVSENNDQKKIDEIAQIANEIYDEEDPPETIEKAEIEEELYRVNDEGEAKEEEAEIDNGNECESDDSTHSEYLPTKPTPPKIKCIRGKPRKHPVTFKPTGKPRGRSPLLELKAEAPENEIGNFPCPQCKEIFTKISLLEKHAEQHDDLRIHECDSCNKKFRRWNTLKRHKLSHGEVKPFQCMTCRKRFTRRDHLQKHMKLHLSMEVHSCDLCPAVFYRAQNLAKHKASKHNIGEKVVREKKYECEYCEKSFTGEKYRESHMKSHFGDRKFQCETCEKTFVSKAYLTKHMKFHDDNSKKFLCSECGEGFIRNDYLVTHMRRHRGETPFKCKFCGKGFLRTTDLTVHERYHTGEKTHLCVICGKGFGRPYNLTVHMRTHTGEKPYRCTYCDAAFAQGYDLKAHVRRHTGERLHCELCPKTFVKSYLLTQHKRVVHGMNIDSHIKRLQPINKLDPDDTQPVTDSDPLPTEVLEVKQEVLDV